MHHQSFTCPYCGQFGLTNIDLLNHIDEEHPDNTQEVVCAGLLSTRCGKNEYHSEFLGQYFPSDWWCPHLPTCRSQTAQLMKTGKYSFERGIIALHFGGKLRKSPFTHFRGSVANSLYKFHFRASLSLSLYYRSPGGAAAERIHQTYRECWNSSHLVIFVGVMVIIK